LFLADLRSAEGSCRAVQLKLGAIYDRFSIAHEARAAIVYVVFVGHSHTLRFKKPARYLGVEKPGQSRLRELLPLKHEIRRSGVSWLEL
jgi:hypothetical protein